MKKYLSVLGTIVLIFSTGLISHAKVYVSIDRVVVDGNCKIIVVS